MRTQDQGPELGGAGEKVLLRTCFLQVEGWSSAPPAQPGLKPSPKAHQLFELGQFVLLMQNGANNRTYSGFAVRAEAWKALRTISNTHPRLLPVLLSGAWKGEGSFLRSESLVCQSKYGKCGLEFHKNCFIDKIPNYDLASFGGTSDTSPVNYARNSSCKTLLVKN